jgi:hypothetical protein
LDFLLLLRDEGIFLYFFLLLGNGGSI